MKCVFRIALGCWCVLAYHGVVSAQPTTPPAATLVAVVDIPKVFDAHPHFKAGREAKQRELANLEAEFAGKQKSLATKSEKLKNFNPASKEYKELEAQITRELADLQIQARQAKKDFLLREARDYYQAYTEVLTAVEQVAVRHHIGLVLRFDSSEIDPSSPQSVAQGMNRPVVLQRNLDITQMVTDELQVILVKKSRAPAPGRPGGPIDRTAQPSNLLPRR